MKRFFVDNLFMRYLVYRSKPVLQLVANFTFLSKKKVISLNEHGCSLKNKMPVSCVTLQMCLQYDGVGVEEQIGKDLRVNLVH